MTVRDVLLRCTFPVEASSDKEQYYVWWLIVVLYQVIFTFGYHLGQAGIQSDVPPW